MRTPYTMDTIKAATATLACAADEITNLACRSPAAVIEVTLSADGRLLALRGADARVAGASSPSLLRVLFDCRAARSRKGALTRIDEWAGKQYRRARSMPSGEEVAEDHGREAGSRTAGPEPRAVCPAPDASMVPTARGRKRRGGRRRGAGRRALSGVTAGGATGAGHEDPATASEPLAGDELACRLAHVAAVMGLVGDPRSGYRACGLRTTGPRAVAGAGLGGDDDGAR